MIQDLDVILSEGESYTVEFKETADKSLASEVCAFQPCRGSRRYFSRSRLKGLLKTVQPSISRLQQANGKRMASEWQANGNRPPIDRQSAITAD